jgi:hypothetical protein
MFWVSQILWHNSRFLRSFITFGMDIEFGLGRIFSWFLLYPESILVGVHCRQLHWFFVEMLQLCQ